MQLQVQQLKGTALVLEVMPEMTVRQLKKVVKETQTWEDCVRNTTVVELIFGGKKLDNDETLGELGLSSESELSVVFKQNVSCCSHRDFFALDLDPEVAALLEIPDSETEIAARAFFGCKRVARVRIPDSVSRIGDQAFHFCSLLQSVSITGSVCIGTGAFAGCFLLSSITMESVSRIEESAFFNCSSLKSLQLSKSLSFIGHNAFNSCRSLTHLIIPDSVTHLGDDAFFGCGITLTVPAHLAGSLPGCKMLLATESG